MPGAPRRFDQMSLTDVMVAGGSVIVAVLLFALGRALRVIDDQLADFGPTPDID